MKRNGFTIIELLIVITIMGILIAIVAGAYEDAADEQEQTEQEAHATDLKVLELRGRKHKEAMKKTAHDSENLKSQNTVELCHDGLVLVVITKDGKEYSPVYKENRYGDNERCTE